MKKNLIGIGLCLLILLSLSGLNLAAQGSDSTQLFSAPGFMFRNSLIKMQSVSYYQDRVKGLERTIHGLNAKVSLMAQLAHNLETQNAYLETQVSIHSSMYQAKEVEILALKQEHKKQLLDTRLKVGGIGIGLGIILTLLFIH